MQAFAEQVLESIREIVEQQGTQTTFSGLLVLATHEAIDILSIRVDEFTQDVNTQVARCTSQQHVAQLLAFTTTECR